MPEQVQTWTIKRLLEWTSAFFQRKNVDPPRLSAEMLLAHVIKVPRIKLYTDYDREIPPAELASFRELVKRASEEEPIAYLTGKAPFFNLEFQVSRDVLIPRPDTETLVENVLQLIRRTTGFESPRVLDLCTGSGCIAAAIAHHHAAAAVVAVDISPTAVVVAKANIDRLKLTERVTVLEGNLFEPLSALVEQTPFDLIVANPPYISTAEMETLPRSVREYEPHSALEGGPDGLTIHRQILSGAGARIRSGGRVFLEIAYNQAERALAMAAEHSDFADARILKDFGGNDRVLTLTRN